MLKQEYIRDEQLRIIGYRVDFGDSINYTSVSKGYIGTYYKSTNTYVRNVQIPGRERPFPGSGDYGESDIRYWG